MSSRLVRVRNAQRTGNAASTFVNAPADLHPAAGAMSVRVNLGAFEN
jgi:hypothetical protein